MLACSSNVRWFGNVLGLGMCSKYAPYFFTCVCEPFEHFFRDCVEVFGTKSSVLNFLGGNVSSMGV